MHEWALAEAVAMAAVKAAHEEKLGQITEIRVTLGALQSLEQDIFEFGLREMLAQQTPAAADVLVTFNREAARFHCRVCAHDWSFDEEADDLAPEEREAIHFLPEMVHAYLKCPACGSPDFAITAGRGISAVSVVGVPRED